MEVLRAYFLMRSGIMQSRIFYKIGKITTLTRQEQSINNDKKKMIAAINENLTFGA